MGDVKEIDDEPSSLTVEGNTLLSRRPRVFHRFTQQKLPACKPVLTPTRVITSFMVLGIIFIPFGLVVLHASRSVVEVVDRYDAECVPEAFRSNKVSYIRDSSIGKNCSRFLKIPKHMKAPIYIYYQLDNYFQNHRRISIVSQLGPCAFRVSNSAHRVYKIRNSPQMTQYVKSRSDMQLLHGLEHHDTGSCQPEERNNGLPIVPCGLIAWSLFNDTFTFIRERSKLKVEKKNIAWKSDHEHKFGKHVFPFNFQNGTLIGGAKLDTTIPLSDQEDLIVWMRTSALHSFRKLYGRIERDLEADDVLVVRLMNNYNTYSFGGKKKLVLSTSSWLGGRNDFLGAAYVFVGSSSIILSFALMLLHVKRGL